MLDYFENLLLSYGYIGLFIASFLASTILPFGSEGIVALLVYKSFNVFAVVLVASVGNFLGACTTYYIGSKGRSYTEKHLGIKSREIEKAEKYFSRYGIYLLLFTWLPLIGDAITVTGGFLRIRFPVFSILVFTGRFLSYMAFAYLAGAILLPT